MAFRRGGRDARFDRVAGVRHQLRPFHRALAVVRAHEARFLGRQIALVDAHLGFRKRAQHVVAQGERDADVRLHRRLPVVHQVQLREEARVAVRVAHEHRHPADRQRARSLVLGRDARVHQRARFVDERGPLRGGHLAVAIHRQARELFFGKVLVVHGHQLQGLEPIGQLGLRAVDELAVQLRETFAQTRRLLDLPVEHRDLPCDDRRERRAGLGQVGADVGERQAETTQRLDLVEPGDVVAVVQPVAVVGARRRLEQADRVVVVQRADRQPAAFRQLSDLEQHSCLCFMRTVEDET